MAKSQDGNFPTIGGAVLDVHLRDETDGMTHWCSAGPKTSIVWCLSVAGKFVKLSSSTNVANSVLEYNLLSATRKKLLKDAKQMRVADFLCQEFLVR